MGAYIALPSCGDQYLWKYYDILCLENKKNSNKKSTKTTKNQKKTIKKTKKNKKSTK